MLNSLTNLGSLLVTRARRRRWMASIAAAVLLCAGWESAAFANACVWNKGTLANWNLTTSWTSCGSAVPQPTDTVTFGSSQKGSCTVDANVSVASITISSGYTGTITPNSGITVTTTGGFSQADGIFTGSTGRISVGGAFALSGTAAFTAPSGLLDVGTFSETGSATFAPSTGRLMLTGPSGTNNFVTNGETFNHLFINDGLVGYWKLDDASSPSVDSSGYGRDATWSSTPVSSSTVASVNFTNSKSLGIDSALDYASFTAPSLPIITIAAWINATASGGGGSYQRILEQVAYNLYIDSPTSGDNPMSLGFTSNRAASAVGEFRTPTDSLTYGAWYHVAVTYDSSDVNNYPAMYINGVAQTPITRKAVFSGAADDNAGTAVIGNRISPAVDRYFNGFIDDLRIYDRQLSAAEIYALYIGNQPGTTTAVQNVTGTPIVGGDLVIASGTLGLGTTSMQVKGNWWNYGGIFTSGSSGLVSFTGTSGSKIIRSAGQMFGAITVNGTGGTWTLGDRLEMNPASTLTTTAGTFDLSSYTFRGGNIDKNGVAVTPSTGTVVLNGSTNVLNGSTDFATDQGAFTNLRIEPVGATNLVGYWKLDLGQGLTAIDYSGNNNHGTLTNGPLWNDTGLPPLISFDNAAAVTFDRTSLQYIATASLPAVLQPATVTMSAWYKATTVDTNGADLISGSDRYSLRVQSNTSLQLSKQTASSTWVGLTGTVAGALNGSWHHIAGVITSTGMTLYFDGAPVTSNANTTAIYYTSPVALYIGKNPNDGTFDFSGTIDDVRIYNTALTAAQIAALASGTYPAGLAGASTYTLGANTTVTGTLAVDSGTLATSTFTMAASSASVIPTVNSGTYSVGSVASTFTDGLTIKKYGTLDMPTSGGIVKLATTKVLTIDGTLSASSTGATIQSVSGNYTFTVGSTSAARPTLNISGLAVKNTDTNGMYINTVAGSTTTFTQFDNIAFSSGTGNYLLRIYDTSLALYANGLSFDASTTSNLKLVGNGTGDGETRAYIGATCTSSPCESFDADDDSEPDGTGDTGVLGDEAVAQWIYRGYNDTAGTIQGFPTTAFSWTGFIYWNTYVVYRDIDGVVDRLYARNTDGAFLNSVGGAGYYWDLPSGKGDIIGTPRWTVETGVHYVYVITTLGYVYKLSDSGTAFAVVAGWPYQNTTGGAAATATSPLILDGSNLYWTGNDGAATRKMFSLSFAKVPNGTRALVADVVAVPALGSVAGTPYFFTATNGKIYRTPLDLSGEITSTQSTSIVYGRITVLAGAVYFPEDIGKVWALSGVDLTATPTGAGKWSYQDTDTSVGHHVGGCSANSQCTVRNLYVDPLNMRTYFGDKDGHVYVVSNTGAAIAGYPFRPGLNTDEFQTAPLYRAGVIVIGSVSGKVFIIDQSAAVSAYKTFNFQSAISSIAYDTDGYYVIGTASGKLYYLTAVTDPTPGST